MVGRKFPVAPPPKPRALIVFGCIAGSTMYRAGWFGPGVVEEAKKAAAKFGLRWLSVSTDDHRDAARLLREGVLNSHRQFSLSPASPEIIEILEILFARDNPGAKPPEGPDADVGGDPAGAAMIGAGDSAAMPQTAASDALEPPPEANPAADTQGLAEPFDSAGDTERRAGAIEVEAGDNQPPDPTTAAAAPNEASPTVLWDNLRVGQVVLGAYFNTSDKRAGWWEAEIVEIKGDEIEVRWLDADSSQTHQQRRNIALHHPEFIAKV